MCPALVITAQVSEERCILRGNTFPSSKINQKGSEFILRAKADL